MNRRITLMWLILTFGIITLYAQEPVPRDTSDITPRLMQFPRYLGKWDFGISAGLSFVRPPKDLVEQSLQAPLVNIHMNFGLPWHLSLESELYTILVSNQLSLGPRYTWQHKNFGIKAGWDVAFVYGQMKQYGFNNSTMAWLHYPNLSVGYKLKNMSFTLKGEVVVLASAVTKSGENELDHSKNIFLGHTVGFYLEQRLHKKKVFVIGIKNNNLRYYWPTWMIFSTFNRYYNIPELNFSWIL
jgi:hypothetical protein